MAAIVDNRPAIVGVVSDGRTMDSVGYETVRVRYLEALRSTAGVLPLTIPGGLAEEDLQACLSVLNGVLLTGAESNVSPSLYGGPEACSETLDLNRDRTSIAAIKIALSSGIPLFGICRGLQELNVALGGTLSSDISKGEGRIPHMENLALPRDLQYAPSHAILAEGNGCIAECIRRSQKGAVLVNTLHRQGIARLADGLAVDARCVDGVIEAVSVKDATTFAAAVQWHPEWFHAEDWLSVEVFRAFGEACRSHMIATKLRP
ncbi:gamma-glutamyl-gamma-aminobutyrate hydrolase family protein (plasmid) [Rhizobium sp. CB3090]|uniref:gamma-glutamyl-gamma-aminobutyrate hydrolase family protein n=1 Tax=Rhizobium sp. CB3090 TaxID=3039156 RepID=UPI0024B27988|nr:gamma-glutamyl-gamma-aminobutyrate hydrolase family protein [Rhizobium sp. CB3090]WFU12925.1 gamma-glutamyl-gamma-aminobutyrate hydrolase family protein [Rhizobium sp. CB3090]